MQRRSLLKLGIASAAVLAVAGGAAALIEPGLVDNRLSGPARSVFTAVAPVMLEGAMASPTNSAEMLGLLDRINDLIAGLPPASQVELSQLLSIMAAAPGRLALAGLSSPWGVATSSDVARALQDMRLSKVSLRQQAYQALHDICGGAWFADASAWSLLSYPGPTDL